MGHGSSLGPTKYEKRSTLARAKGYGSSYRGVKEWLLSRILATFSIPLSLYVLICLLAGVANSYERMHAWLSNPFNATVLALAIVTLAGHGILGLSTVINDYVHNKGMNFFLLLFVRAFFGFIIVFSIVSILFTLI